MKKRRNNRQTYTHSTLFEMRRGERKAVLPMSRKKSERKLRSDVDLCCFVGSILLKWRKREEEKERERDGEKEAVIE